MLGECMSFRQPLCPQAEYRFQVKFILSDRALKPQTASSEEVFSTSSGGSRRDNVERLQGIQLLGTRTLLGTKGIATRSKDATSVSLVVWRSL